MKVLLFSRSYPEYMVSLANAMANRAQQVVLMLPYQVVDIVLLQCISKKVVFERYNIVYHKSFRDNLTFIFHLVRRINHHHPDILHLQDNGVKQFHFVLPFLKRKMKVVNTIHDPEKHLGDHITQDMDRAVNACKKITAKYLVHGNYLKNQLVDAYRVQPDKIDVVKHGNLALYQQWSPDKTLKTKLNQFSGQKILFFGRILQYKGLGYLLKAFPGVRKKLADAHLVIAGRGDHVEDYLPDVKDYPDFISLNYKLSNNEVNSLFQACDIVVLPYIEATQSVVIPLSLAYGKPVVATRVGAIPEMIDDEEEGLLVDTKDEYALEEAIVRLLNDKALYRTMSDKAKKKAEEKLGWEDIARNTVDIYKNLRDHRGVDI